MTAAAPRPGKGTRDEAPAVAPGALADLLGLGAFLAATLMVAAVGGLATGSSVGDWYRTLEKPWFNPPDAVFGPVWTVLYVLIALAGWRVWRRLPTVGGHSALGLWGVQLALNLLWTVLFFGLRRPSWALLEIVALWVVILVTIRMFWRLERAAGLLLVPYLLWVGYAAVLNLAVWWLNRGGGA